MKIGQHASSLHQSAKLLLTYLTDLKTKPHDSDLPKIKKKTKLWEQKFKIGKTKIERRTKPIKFVHERKLCYLSGGSIQNWGE